MKKKIGIIIAVVIAIMIGVVAIVCKSMMYEDTVKPIATWKGSVGSWTNFYLLEIHIYENGKGKLIGSDRNNVKKVTVSFEVEENKVGELQQKIEELKFKDIREDISFMANDYGWNAITVNYEDGSSHKVVKTGLASYEESKAVEQWEWDNYNELEEEIWSLVPEKKQNKLESKIKEPATILELIIWSLNAQKEGASLRYLGIGCGDSRHFRNWNWNWNGSIDNGNNYSKENE